ncbi:MAG: class II aldolase/adducin family protein [Sedimentisphaerales bacterium]|nr:class II aldolase/adducin family protein [Sedimentisphaerales bacterium]
MAQNMTLRELIHISRTVGSDTDLVQAGSGNTSAKTDDGQYMYIKASGTAIRDMNQRHGWRRLRLEQVRDVIADKTLSRRQESAREKEVIRRLLLACDDPFCPQPIRPSIEAHLHSILDKFVIHLHPRVVNAYINAKKGEAVLKKLFQKEKFPPLWLPYADPGYMLGRKMACRVADYHKRYGRNPAIMFLARHGLFISATTSEQALRLVRKVVKTCKRNLPKIKSVKIKPLDNRCINAARLAIRQGLFEITGQSPGVRHVMNKTVAAFMARRDARQLLNAGPLAPDELAYVHGPPLWLNEFSIHTITHKLRRQMQKGSLPPTAFIVKDLGLFVTGDTRTIPTIQIITESFLYVRMSAANMGGLSTLNKRQQNFVINWESGDNENTTPA